MRRIATAVAAVVVVVSTAGAPGASARSAVTWTDPADDATLQPPAPSEPTLDVVRSTASTDGTRLSWTIAIKRLGPPPPGSTGYSFRFHFSYDDVGYFFDVGESVLGPGTSFAAEEGDPTSTLGCAGCDGRIDRARSTVSLSVPLTTIRAGVKATSPTSPPPGRGGALEQLAVDTWRDEVLVVVLADRAVAPEAAAVAL